MGVDGNNMKLSNKGLIDIPTSDDSNCIRFAKFITENMTVFEQIMPSFKRLKETMMLYVIVKWSV